jgi:hypothetical protein
MSIVTALPSPDERVPERSPYLHDARWLISMCARDHQMVLLMRHLHRVHRVVTVADLDAAGWNIVNTYRGKLAPAKLDAFFRRLGRKRPGLERRRPPGGAKVLSFTSLRP